MHTPALADCYFYQTIWLPEIGLCEGSWDHRNTVDEYLGHVDVKGKVVLDAGPANGFFTFEMERRGAQVIALDLGNVGEWDAVPNAHAPWKHGELKQLLAASVGRVENAFWLAHRAFESNARLVYGAIYDAPAIVNGKVDIALISNVMQHLRDPFLAIQRVSEVVKETIIITESIWHDDEVFLNSTDMRFLPRLEIPEYHQSWWLVPPRLVIEILKLLGFGLLKTTYHDELFNGSGGASGGRVVRHYTVTGTRQAIGVRFAEGWHGVESQGSESWRWSSARQARIIVELATSKPAEGYLDFKIGAAEPMTVSVMLNGKQVSKVDCAWPARTQRIANLTFEPGPNVLEFHSDRPPVQVNVADPRQLGYVIFDIECQIPDLPHQGIV